jgi:hypothetical protein
MRRFNDQPLLSPSELTWLAYSGEELRRAHDLAATLSEQETRDELGVGSIRDGIADRLFPGTSTIQSRARYFLFLPWLFQNVERQPVGRARERSERAERELIAALRRSTDSRGLVGGRTSLVERLPSVIYWNGLAVLGVRRVTGSLANYYRWLDDPSRHTRIVRDDDGGAIAGAIQTWWDRVPNPPGDFPDAAEFALTHSESRYLADRSRAATSQETLLSFLFDRGSPHDDVPFPWNHPQGESMPAAIRDDLEVAKAFSTLHRGAALLFNLLIAEARDDQSHIESYRDQLADWQSTGAASILSEARSEYERIHDLNRDRYRIGPTASPCDPSASAQPGNNCASRPRSSSNGSASASAKAGSAKTADTSNPAGAPPRASSNRPSRHERNSDVEGAASSADVHAPAPHHPCSPTVPTEAPRPAPPEGGSSMPTSAGHRTPGALATV